MKGRHFIWLQQMMASALPKMRARNQVHLEIMDTVRDLSTCHPGIMVAPPTITQVN